MSRNPLPPHAKKVFAGRIFQVYQWEQEMFDGSKATFERLTRPDSTMVIPVTLDGQIVIVHQNQPNNHGLIGIPGGRVDRGEDPLLGAKRELAEETGYVSEDWQSFFQVDPSEKIIYTLHYYIARHCQRTQEPDLDAGEQIELKLVSFEDFLEIATTPTFDNAVLSLHLLRLMREQSKLSAFRRLLLG